MRMISWSLSHDCTWINNPCTSFTQIRQSKAIRYKIQGVVCISKNFAQGFRSLEQSVGFRQMMLSISLDLIYSFQNVHKDRLMPIRVQSKIIQGFCVILSCFLTSGSAWLRLFSMLM